MIKKIHSKKGSTSVEAAILMVPVFLMAFIFISMFSKNSIEMNTSYALKEAIEDAIIQPSLGSAKSQGEKRFVEVLNFETKKNGNPKYVLDQTNGSAIQYAIYDINHNSVSLDNGNWCKDYYLEMKVNTKTTNNFISENDYYNESVFSTAIKTSKTITARIQNAPVCR